MKVRTVAERGGSPFGAEAHAIAGRFIAGEGGPFEVRYPATQETLVTLHEASEAQCEEALVTARRSFDRGDWRMKKGWERAAVLDKAAAIVLSRVEALARPSITKRSSARLPASVRFHRCCAALPIISALPGVMYPICPGPPSPPDVL